MSLLPKLIAYTNFRHQLQMFFHRQANLDAFFDMIENATETQLTMTCKFSLINYGNLIAFLAYVRRVSSSYIPDMSIRMQHNRAEWCERTRSKRIFRPKKPT